MGHGVNVKEVPTGVKPVVKTNAGLPVYIGTAPISAGDLTFVNKAAVFNNLAEAVAKCGPLSTDFDSWTLHEAIRAHFQDYGVGPIVCINVLDPENAYHVATATAESHQLVNGSVALQVYGGADVAMRGILKSTVVVKNQAGSQTYTLGTDYTLAFDVDGFLVVTVVAGHIASNAIITANFDYLDPSAVTAEDVIGGVSGGVFTGLEVVTRVFPTLRLVPGLIVAPKYSQEETVAARMTVLAHALNGAFRTMAVTDLSTNPSDIADYIEAPAWKTAHNYNQLDQIALWPKGKFGDLVYHASTLFACAVAVTDAANNGTPHVSPSNKPLFLDAAVLDDGTEVLLDLTEANALNEQGIVTLLNGFNGWRLWGNRTAVYPGNTDPKDAFIPIRRMFNWIGNTIQLTTNANVDDALNRRLIDLVNGTLTSFLNSLVAQGALIDGDIQFLADDNSVTDLSDGKIVWDVSLSPPPPAEDLTFKLQYDPSALASLFA